MFPLSPRPRTRAGLTAGICSNFPHPQTYRLWPETKHGHFQPKTSGFSASRRQEATVILSWTKQGAGSLAKGCWKTQWYAHQGLIQDPQQGSCQHLLRNCPLGMAKHLVWDLVPNFYFLLFIVVPRQPRAPDAAASQGVAQPSMYLGPVTQHLFSPFPHDLSSRAVSTS